MALVFDTPARYLGLNQSKNPEYVTLQFCVPETYRGIEIPVSQQVQANARITVKSSELPSFGSLVPNSYYQIKLGIGVGKANGNYPASLQFDLVKVLGEIKPGASSSPKAA
jgi:hypothetical protein